MEWGKLHPRQEMEDHRVRVVQVMVSVVVEVWEWIPDYSEEEM